MLSLAYYINIHWPYISNLIFFFNLSLSLLFLSYGIQVHPGSIEGDSLVILSFCLFSLSQSLSGIQVHPELQESFFKGGDSRNWFIFSLIGNRADNPSLLHNLRPAGPAYKVHYLLLASTCTSHQIGCNVHKKLLNSLY